MVLVLATAFRRLLDGTCVCAEAAATETNVRHTAANVTGLVAKCPRLVFFIVITPSVTAIPTNDARAKILTLGFRSCSVVCVLRKPIDYGTDVTYSRWLQQVGGSSHVETDNDCVGSVLSRLPGRN